jgi:4-amino-4-deoxy-L-arabinose transferase-like glycosyltransferase
VSRRRSTALALLLAVAIVPYFLDLGGSSIWDANEAFYVETPREMMEQRDYVTPTFNYEPRLNKPVLSYWIVAGFYQLFGVSVAVQRVPIALGALVLILTAACLAGAASTNGGDGRRHSSASGTRTATEAALWAGLGLALTPRLLMFARRIFIDVYISMFLGLTLLFFVLAERVPDRRRTWLVLMYVAAGLGTLTKGPVAIVLPALAFGLYLLWHSELRRLESMMLPAGAVIVLSIVAPWYVALFLRHGWGPVTEFVLGENFARYTTGVGVDSERGPLFYLPVLISDSFPWSMFLVAAAMSWWRARKTGAAREPAQRIRALLGIWVIVFVAFFSASAAKQDLYIFPIVPAVAALAGVTIASGPSGAVRWTSVATGAIIALAGAGVLYLFGPGASVYALRGALAMGGTAVAGGLFVAGSAATNRVRESLIAIAVTLIILDWVFVLRVLPDFERFKPVPGFAATLSSRIQPDDALITYDEALPSLVFYLRRHIDPYFLPDEVFERFRENRGIYAIMSPENHAELAPRIRVRTCIIDRRPTFNVKLKNMLNRDSLPELLLITNRCGP